MNKTLIASLLLILAGCTQAPPISNYCEFNGDCLEYSLSEVSTHNSKNDCWTIIDNKVYDITVFINNHPGGEVIIGDCGIDSTSLFSGKPHSSSARSMLDDYYIGELKQ